MKNEYFSSMVLLLTLVGSLATANPSDIVSHCGGCVVLGFDYANVQTWAVDFTFGISSQNAKTELRPA